MIKKILSLYKDCHLFTKFHIFVRYFVCPFRKIETFLPEKGDILDFGCGYGLFSHILLLLSEEREILGMDHSVVKIREANKTLQGNPHIQFTTDVSTNGRIGKADCIAILDVLCYFSEGERSSFLKKIYEQMKSGATLIIKDVRPSFSIKFFLLYLQEILVVKIFRITKAKGLYFFKQENLLKFLKGLGLQCKYYDISRGYWYPHVLFVCKK